MKESLFIEKAKKIIDSVRGKPLSLNERKESAIELAALMLEEAQRTQKRKEKKQQAELSGMMRDPMGKVFTTAITDQCFRSHRTKRIADQLVYVLNTYGVPEYLPLPKKIALESFKKMGCFFHSISVPCTISMIRREASAVILPGEERLLKKHMKKRKKEGVRVNLNHLGEAILGEEEAATRLKIYLDDLSRPEVEYISIKISTIYSQIQLLSWDETLEVLAERLRLLYRAAIACPYKRADGTLVPKFINLDMEEYRDLHLTVALFQKVLNEPEFYHYSAGIVLQSYLPDSYLIQQELTIWAMQRVIQGGAPIKIRIVKGANLAMEQFEASLRLWPQAPYRSKSEVDANYKRMVNYGTQKNHAEAAHLGIASHNLFDIAYALLLRSENEIESKVCFEMLEGMADHMRRVVQKLSGDMLLYCPAATKGEFQNAVAYLVRRLDENTAPENFLHHLFDLTPNSPEWKQQAKLFSDACVNVEKIGDLPQRTQNRSTESLSECHSSFKNEADTDWSLPQNRRWVERIIGEWKEKKHPLISSVIGGKEIVHEASIGEGTDPSFPNKTLYRYSLASEKDIDEALTIAKNYEATWKKSTVNEREHLLSAVAEELRRHRGDLIGAMIADTGKTVMEGDVEISEAIDFAEYYKYNLKEWHAVPGIDWKSKGTVLVAPPWNFPCSISAGGVLAALAAGNCVIYKPPAEALLVAWTLVQLFWKAGVSKEALQFIVCEDDPVGSVLVKDPRISTIILTGGTATAKLFLKMRPGVDLIAETGGKNSMVITGMADRDLAIKDLVHSAFGHSGQKCSACSLAILEAEVYDDPHFLQQLKDAAGSLAIGSPWDLKTKVNPLIHPPSGALKKGLMELEEGESWLLEPKQIGNNPNLWSPGIKLGVHSESFTFQHELFGPVLSLVRAKNVDEAFELMNLTPYGLTAGIHSLDEREQEKWMEQIVAGNCYVNRTITGAVVERQPFGGCKESGFGRGAKAGGPNYLLQLMDPIEKTLPRDQGVLSDYLEELTTQLKNEEFPKEDFDLWEISIHSYSFYWNEYFAHLHDLSLVRGQDNFQGYVPHYGMVLRGQQGDSLVDLLRVYAAGLTCGTELIISLEDPAMVERFKQLGIEVSFESNETFSKKIVHEEIKRIRFLKSPPHSVLSASAEVACNLVIAPVVAIGRIELLHALREVSISRDYHRYGNLGEREHEERAALPSLPCKGCCCSD